MVKYLEKITEYGFYLFIFLLPWQTRWIWHQGLIKGNPWEYGSFSLYGTDLIFLVILVFSFIFPKRRLTSLNRFWVLIVAFLFICLFSVLQSQNKEISWYFIIRIMQAILLLWLILRIRFKWAWAGVALAAAGVIQSLLAIYQFFTQAVIANKWLGMAAHEPGALGDFVVETVSGRWLRAYGSFPHPNILAGFLVVCLFILIGLILHLSRHRRVNIFGIIVTVSSFVLVSFGLILTFSRSALLIFLLVFILAIVISWYYKNKYRLKILGQAGIWLALLILFSIFMIPEVWQTRINITDRLEARSWQERSEYIVQAKDIIKDYWYQGTGVGSYTQALYNQDSSEQAWDYQPVHNIYLLVAAETGVFGGLIFLLIGFEFFRSLAGYTRRKLINDEGLLIGSLAFSSIMLIGLFDHYWWSMSFGLLFFWLVLGCWLKRSHELET